MCNSLPPRAAHLQPVDDARSVVEGPRPRGEHDCNIFLTLTPLIGPWRGPWRSQALPNITHAQPSAYWRQTGEASGVQAGRERLDHGGLLTQTKLHHWLSWVSSLQREDHGTSHPP